MALMRQEQMLNLPKFIYLTESKSETQQKRMGVTISWLYGAGKQEVHPVEN
jgi:hypothetical protein